MKNIAGVLTVFVVMPIWLYLLYKILVAVNASELMFFLFWIYIPISVFVRIVANMYEAK